MIVASMAISDFPMWENSVKALLPIVDKFYFRLDVTKADPAFARDAPLVCGAKFGACYMVEGWNFPEWRQDMIRMLDDVKPEIVITLDQDEIFDDGFEEELKAFMVSEKKGMMFDYLPMVTDDGRTVNGDVPYPPDPHMKVFKWEAGLTYYPYHGDGKIANYHKEDCHWKAKTKIKHYCCYTKAMEADKQFKSHTPKGKGVKVVTLIGFGPSMDEAQPKGEIWTLNNGYTILASQGMQRCTRIFEMHNMEKLRARDQKEKTNHVFELDKAGRSFRRIIMQKPEPLIYNSEAFPLAEAKDKFGMLWAAGSPCYMMMMAIMEGYTHIRIYGLDQMDWEHTLQRECFAGWCMFALGRGIRLSGRITWLERYTKLYGYDYGPEWDDYQEEMLWAGHPIQIKYKIPSRVVDGKMFKKGGK